MLELSVSRLLTKAFALGASALPALAGKSEYKCQVFAHISIAQLQDSVAHRCGWQEARRYERTEIQNSSRCSFDQVPAG